MLLTQAGYKHVEGSLMLLTKGENQPDSLFDTLTDSEARRTVKQLSVEGGYQFVDPGSLL